MKILNEYQKEVEGYSENFTVRFKENDEFPYTVIASHKSIVGMGKTKKEAKNKCEGAVLMDIKNNTE